MDQCPRDRHPLLLAAGQFPRLVLRARFHPHASQTLSCAPAGRRATLALQEQRQRHVILGGQRGEKMKGLEDHADQGSPQPGPFPVGQIMRGTSFQKQAARRRRIEPRDDVQQRAFPASAWPHQGAELAFRHMQTDIPERRHGSLAPAIIFRDLIEPDHVAACCEWIRFSYTTTAESPTTGRPGTVVEECSISNAQFNIQH